MSRDNQTFAAFSLPELKAAAAGTAALFLSNHRAVKSAIGLQE